MSDFMDALVDLLPEHNSLKKPQNQLRRVLDLSVGEWFDRHSIQSLYDNLFLMNAVGGYLDCHGRDYGVYRQTGETDTAYRERIVQEKLDYLTPKYLNELYRLTLYVYVSQFDATNNDLTTDNPYIPSVYMAHASEETKNILKNKFILDNEMVWLNEDLTMDYIVNNSNVDLFLKYLEIYDKTSLVSYFEGNTTIKNVKLNLQKARTLSSLFKDCTRLYNVKLTAPTTTTMATAFRDCTLLDTVVVDGNSCQRANGMFYGCTKLQYVTLNLPKLEADYFNNIFKDCTKLKSIEVTIPRQIKNSFKSYVLGLNLQYLTTFIINGEEVDLS